MNAMVDARSILAEIDAVPLSTLLQRALRVARERGDTSLAHWIQLELHGYHNTNPELRPSDVVPAYRTVVGQHANDYGQVLRLPDPDLGFVNEMRLRTSIPELEELQCSGGALSLYDPHTAALIREHMGVEVTRYTFDTRQLVSIFAAVRTRLAEALDQHAPMSPVTAVSRANHVGDEILELKPNVAGIGINLRALGRWILAWWRRRG